MSADTAPMLHDVGPLKAPFPAFGGKARVAEEVWARFGDVRNYVEPFCFSAAVLLRRPGRGGANMVGTGECGDVETINDRNCFVTNFWRAVKADPDAVAFHADHPVLEVDLHARHRWMVTSNEAKAMLQRVKDDPDFYDARIAGWWCWGACCWIGSGWCDEVVDPWQTRPNLAGDGGGNGVHRVDWNGVAKRLDYNADGRGKGVSRNAEHLTAGQGVNRSLGRQVRHLTESPAPPSKIPHMDAANGSDGAGESDGGKRVKLSGNGLGSGVHANPKQSLPDLAGDAGATGRGVLSNQAHKKRPRLNTFDGSEAPGVLGDANRPQLADEFARGRGVNGNDRASACEARSEWIRGWMRRLADRLRPVRVCCGHWDRVCDSPSTMTRLGLTGVFLDPPYRHSLSCGKKNRTKHIYANDRNQDVNALCDEVQAWCLKWGPDKEVRIALCGLEGEYPAVVKAGWTEFAWKSNGGYGNRKGGDENENARRERVWFSPHCLVPGDEGGLFGSMGEGA